MIRYKKSYIIIYKRGERMYQDDLRDKLNVVISKGLSANVIAKTVGMTDIDMSRFKNKKICLIDDVAERLEDYLSKVVIP